MGRVRASSAGLRAFSALVAFFGLSAVSVASAHTAGVPIPPQSDYLIRWHQPHGVRPVTNWEIEVTPSRNPFGRFVATAQVVPEQSCWALNVPIAEPAVVRVRSVIGTQVSTWTRPTVVPEPGLCAGIAASSGMLALLVNRRRQPSRQSS